MGACFVLILEVPADHSPLAAQLTGDWLAACATALQTQLRRDVTPYWPYAFNATVRVGSGPDDVGATEIPVRLLANLPDAPGAIAYHDDANGYPDAFLGLDTCSTLADVSTALSHELCETCGDPNCDQWVTMPGGRQVALENCDPLQERSYAVDTIRVSDFCLPAYFGFADGATSYGETHGMPALAPFAMTDGGYQIVRNADGSGETQVFGTANKTGRRKARRGLK